jgi:iron donor protein CyaY
MAAGDFPNEAEYRSVIQNTLSRVEKAFYDIDPDVVECSVQFGALTIAFPSGQRCILSSQPAVQQLWMAVAAKGIAFHFDYDHGAKEWRDDRGQGIEPLSFLVKFLREMTGLDIKFT